MSARNDGGPAYPVIELDGDGSPCQQYLGMPMRDYFAARAPLHDLKFATVYALAEFLGIDAPKTEAQLIEAAMAAAAKASYIFADAMLKAREE